MRVIIVGAGMSGLCMAIALDRAGIPWEILEKSPTLGGTWWENTYPGCACDIPSHLYAFSFAPHPGWSRLFPGQAEILAYLRRLADDHGLTDRIRFGVEVRQARWEEAEQRWVLSTSAGELRADVFVSAVGALHVPRYPDIPGRERFQGASFHSARWDHQVPLQGRRVGVIGNAASAVQFVPVVAGQAAQLTIYQRSAHWILPRRDRPYPGWVRSALRLRPLQRAYRGWLWLWQELLFLLVFSRGSLVGRLLAARLRGRIARSAADPALRAALTPDYPPGCKRALLSDDYYPTLARPNVRLVTEPIRGIEAGGLRVGESLHELDVLVYATGFQPFGPGGPEVLGRGGRSLAARWDGCPRAYLGLTVPEFPNYFLLLGPNTGLGHNSVMWMVECQVAWVVRCLQALRARRAAWLEVREEALTRFGAWLDRRLAGKVWRDCRSWYRNEAGQNYTLWPATTARYAWATRRPRLARDFVLGGQARGEEEATG